MKWHTVHRSVNQCIPTLQGVNPPGRECPPAYLPAPKLPPALKLRQAGRQAGKREHLLVSSSSARKYESSLSYFSRSTSLVKFTTAFVFVMLISALPVYAAETGGFTNPLKSEYSTVSGFIAGALRAMVMVALPVLALFIVFSGFKFIAAQGNPQKLGEAKMNFVYVILGALLILGAWIIATLIGGTVSQLTGTSS